MALKNLRVLLAVSAALASFACTGTLYIDGKPCPENPCPEGLVCNSGVCVVPSCPATPCGTGESCVAGRCVVVVPCNPSNANGACTDQRLCQDGICYVPGTQPPACSPTYNGQCPNPADACISGACVPINVTNSCSPANPAGLCPGGEICINGWCYVDDGLGCSPNNLAGLCPPGETCQGGFCSTDVSTCSSVNWQGTCPSWQTCVQGQCVGPIPPDMCSPTNPQGRCPTSEVCVSGTCTPLTSENTCSDAHPNGLCPTGSACVAGSCVAIDGGNGCSVSNPAGLCPGGAVCQAGVCVQQPCGLDGWLCDVGEWCVGQTCTPLPCDPVHPDGVCSNATDACNQGICGPPTCAPDEPNGSCPANFECIGGNCDLPPCSLSHPFGACSTGDVCLAGVCVEGACAPDNLDGICSSLVQVCHPVYGCNNMLPGLCCDGGAQSAPGCALGSCVAPACSAVNPTGACPADQYCNNGTCILAPCSPYYLDGYCNGANEQCILGRCTKTGCADEVDPNAYCAPDICDLGLDRCYQPPCSAQYPDGFCPIGEACCDAALVSSTSCSLGSCFTPPCSAEFPGGACPSGRICAGGQCLNPPCSAQNPNGMCGPNFVCNAGQCELAVCSALAPQGFCPVGQRCTSGSCQPYVCGATFPNGPCPVGTICQSQSCVTPACSSTYPGGACGAAQICAGGSCVDQPCSSTYPNGACGAGFVCSGGTCQPGLCSPSVPAGICTGVDAGKVCVSGVCLPYVCGSDFPNGPCPPGQICNNTVIPSVCQVPPCQPPWIGGQCSNVNEVCINGSCVLPACSPAMPSGQCPSSQVCCDASLVSSRGCTLGTCVLAACSPSNPNGLCAPGEVCNAGVCDAVVCSAQYPLGACVGPDAGKICVSGTCIEPCSSTAKSGWCPNSFECVEGSCSVACANDNDCDGISDVNEDNTTCDGLTLANCTTVAGCELDSSGTLCIFDTDGDDAPDAFDRDSDGDLIPDFVEANDSGAGPIDSDGDGLRDFRDTDSDNDFMSDTYEAGSAPGVPRDTNSDGTPDYMDTDSDGDGILDKCEAANGASGLCSNNTVLTSGQVLDSDGDALQDYRDLDSDNDGVSDVIEARNDPWDASTFSSNGVNHDTDTSPDYRDTDSDNDGAADNDEDLNGNGVVDCQLNGAGNVVVDTRASPACSGTINWPGPNPPASSYPYNYNPQCQSSGGASKCVLSETSRVRPDTDGDVIGDAQDGIYLVCSTNNLKPINVFYSQTADYALALEQSFTNTINLTRAGQQMGLTFDDPASSNGSNAVSGFIVHRVPGANAMAAFDADPARNLIEKALAQEADDRASMALAAGVTSFSLVINRNFTSFDGYGVVLSRYRITTSASTTVAQLRDLLAKRLENPDPITGFLNTPGGPASTDFVLQTETLYRYDNGATGAVLVVGALVPSSTPANQSSAYRPQCSTQNTQAACLSRPGCVWSSTCQEDGNYQIPLFFVDNVANGSALAQYGDDLAALCQTMVQANGILDFLWVVDNSGSMAEEIQQVLTSSRLFFGQMNNTEADYRVAQTTTAESRPDWEPTYSFNAATDEASRVNGALIGGFTGAIAGSTAGVTGDRTVAYDCANHPDNCNSVANCAAYTGQGDCTSKPTCAWTGAACIDVVPNCTSFATASACSGPRYCKTLQASGQAACNADAQCTWYNTSPFDCVSDGCLGLNNQNSCDSNPLCQWIDPPGGGTGNAHCSDRVPACTWTGTACTYTYSCCDACASAGATTVSDPACYFASRLPDVRGSGSEFSLLMGEWAAYRAGAASHCTGVDQTSCESVFGCSWTAGVCTQNYCAAESDPEGCDGLPECAALAPLGQAACQANANCNWYNDPVAANMDDCRSNYCATFTDQNNCNAYSACIWVDPPGTANARCRDSGTRFPSACQGHVPAGQVACQGDANCQFYNDPVAANPDDCRSNRCAVFTVQNVCDAYPGCRWVDPPSSTSNDHCTDYGSRAFTTCQLVWPRTAAACTAVAGCTFYDDTSNGTQDDCVSAACAGLAQAACQTAAGCGWVDPPNGGTANAHCTDLGAEVYNVERPGCEWNSSNDTCVPSLGTACSSVFDQASCNAFGPRCTWTGNACRVSSLGGSVLCSGTTSAACTTPANNGCVWDGAACHPQNTYAFRNDAARIAVLLSDEEECYVKDRILPQSCSTFGPESFRFYNDPNRLGREDAYGRFYASRGFTVFGIVGDKANPNLPPGSTNGGCATAQAGNAEIEVAESTGGGWGSICATDLFPTIESIVGSALAKASPYRLEGFINGQRVQPISATIKVAAEVCNNLAEYPLCASGAHMEVVPRSRENGFDYDPVNNTLILYGKARPKKFGDIVVSYRYWVDNDQPPEGDPTCPCPETSGPSCLCPPGQACGYSGTLPTVTNTCSGLTSQSTCEAAPGCAWNTANGGGCFATGLCEPDPTCGGGCPAGDICDPHIGLCVCDPSCGAGCGAGQACDNNSNIHACQGKTQAQCNISGCAWNSTVGACFSTTCGECLCDTTCGGGCPAGSTCIVAGPNCGQCTCDTSCGGGCPIGQQCNIDTNSATCGLCQPPQCGNCPAGYVCDLSTGGCICDTLCGGNCPPGTDCNGDTGSPTCGQCICDTSCGGGCLSGQICNTDPDSATCGLCVVDSSCGVGGQCNVTCSGSDAAACAAQNGCRWAAWLNAGAGACVPVACEVCNPALGQCTVDTNCCNSCGPSETCNPTTGQCQCDTNCGFACAPGLICNGVSGSPTCGLCLCDTSCGGPCPNGLVCDNNAHCSAHTDQTSCAADSACSWDPITAQCLSPSCGRCVVDPTCGNCPPGQVCNPTTGLCEPECPDCPVGQVCDPLTGQCICDQTCGGSCALGTTCDGGTNSPTCGQCVCDTTCGGTCPSGTVCDDGSSCAPLSINGACQANNQCAVDATGGVCFSPTCGLCVIDPTCGGPCPPGFICDPLTGLCTPDPNCGGCPSGFACNPLTGQCEPSGG